MGKRFTFAVSLVGAAALIGTMLTTALASQAPPLHPYAQSGAKRFSVNGSLTVSNVLKVNNNLNVTGNSYLHGKAEVYKSLLVRSGGFTVQSGGIKTDSLNDTGPLQAASATFAGNLQAGTISGTGLNLTGAVTVNGKVSATGGVDAGSGGLSTSGALTAGALTVTGPVDFTKATVTGINVQPNLNNATATNLTVSSALTAGSVTAGATGSSNNPLTLAANGQTAALGVNSAGAVTVNNLAVTGTLTLAQTGGLTVPSVQAPTPAGSSQQALAVEGNGITLNGTTTLNNGSDLAFTTPNSGSASHMLANGDRDVAGTVTINVPISANPGGDNQATVTFLKAFTQQPAITLTALGDPEPGSAAAPKVYYTLTASGSQYTAFTVHLSPAAAVTQAYTANFTYRVAGL